MRHVVAKVTVALAAVLSLGSLAGHASASGAPRLVVVLVVDQMRADYVERYGYQWTRGLHRLIAGGARFRRVTHPYATTVTCVGHATISTGTFPAAHGIVGNAWYDRTLGRTIRCSDQPGATAVSYAGAATGADGPGRLLVPAFADELRAQLDGPTRVVTMSMKERTAIMLAGRRAEAVTWFNPRAQGLVTSSFYTAEPVPFVAAFSRANPIAAEMGTPWERALPAGRYLFDDDGAGEKPPSYWTRTFPHAVSGDTSDPLAWEAWEMTPRPDAYLGRLAIAAIDALKLGQASGTDFLGVSFSALDNVGHDFGPTSHEVQDVLVRLDETIGKILVHLDRTVGPGRYVVALAGDHGAPLIPEQAGAGGMDTGRVRYSAVSTAVQAGLRQALGMGEYRTRQYYNDLYLDSAVADALRANPPAVQSVLRVLKAVPGVGEAYFADSLVLQAAAGDRGARMALRGYLSGRSGDFLVFPKPNWFFVTDDGTTLPGSASSHGSPYGYDQEVPLLFFGAGIKPGEYLRAVTAADIAPTLAFLCGITLPRPDGEVLVEAIRKE